MFSICSKILTKACSSLVHQRENALEHAMSSGLHNPELSNRIKSPDLLKHLIDANQKLQKVELSFFSKTCYKVARCITKIFSRKNTFFDKILQLNNLSSALRKKNLEILNLKSASSISTTLSLFYKNPHIKSSIKIGCMELERLQIRLYLNSLLEAKQSLLQQPLSPDMQKEIFVSLPFLIQQQILNFGKSQGISSSKINKTLDSVFSTLLPSGRSFVQELELSYTSQLNAATIAIAEHKLEFVKDRDPMFSASHNFSTENYVFDCSTDVLTSQDTTSYLDQPVHVAMVAAEYSGLVKEGGLAEAVEGLSKSLREHHDNNKVTLIYPKFSNLPQSVLAKLEAFTVHEDVSGLKYKVYTTELDGVEIKLIDHPSFKLPNGCKSIYGPEDKAQQERFSIFNKLAADFLVNVTKPNIIHLHDWHAAGVLAKIKKDYKEEWESGVVPPVVFTFHNNNRASQGRMHSMPYSYEKVINGYLQNGILTHNDNLFVKTLKDADVVTTVSETFALEAQQPRYGEGVSFAVRDAAKEQKLFGIINGTNPYRWNPETDLTLKNWKDLATNAPLDLSYAPNEKSDLVAKKAEIKQQLKLWVEQFYSKEIPTKVDFDFSKPFVTYVGRFDSYQKGLDKFEEAIQATLANGGQFICMGMGEDSDATKILDKLEKKYKKGVLFIRDFKDPSGKIHFQQGSETRPGIGSLIRACSEFIFVPSRFEPCGLVQFEGWLFGSLAIGSSTGGLVDTIRPHNKNPDTFNGFLFCREAEKAKSCKDTIEEALDFWKKTPAEKQNALMKRLILEGRKYGWDSSPNGLTPTEKYLRVYDLALKASKQRRDSKPNDPINPDSLKLLPFHQVSQFTQNEENYLYHYYNADKLSVSLKKLHELLRKLPFSAQQQHPNPYGKGINFSKYKVYGADLNPETGNTRFALSAPNAKVVILQLFDDNENLVAEHRMKKNASGDWILPDVSSTYIGQRYRYLIDGKEKIDPFARGMTMSKKSFGKSFSTLTAEKHVWNDQEWILRRQNNADTKAALNIYEVHPTTWAKKADGSYLNYKELAPLLVKHAQEHGFSHIELMGILEHPDERSWGYQPNGFFAPNHRLGSIDDFKYMINYLHEHKIGAILDFIPGHFSNDDDGLVNFDGSGLYNTKSWNRFLSLRYWLYTFGAKHFDFSKHHVKEFLLSSAHFWLKEMHLDGIRVDCVSGILRSENPSASEHFIKDLNAMIHNEIPGAISIAEDFSGNPHLLRELSHQGLGFDYKWNTAWNHFALQHFLQTNLSPSKQSYLGIAQGLKIPEQSGQIAFLSHDETNENRAHLYRLLQNLPADKKEARVRSFLSFLTVSNRNYLLFSGLENFNFNFWDTWIGRPGSFDSTSSDDAMKRKLQNMLQAISAIKSNEPAFSKNTSDTTLLSKDATYRVHAYRKTHENNSIVVLHNLTAQEHPGFEIKLKKNDQIQQQPKIIFSSDINCSETPVELNAVLAVSEDATTITYKVKVPAETTMIIKES